MARTLFPIIPEDTLEAICFFIADTNGGLTGTEIQRLLRSSAITDVNPEMSKAKRLFNAFAGSQNHHQCANQVLFFIASAMKPARYFGKDELFHFRLNELNKRLALVGLQLSEKAQYRKVDKAETLSEAQLRVSHFKYKLEMRNVHPEIYRYCNEELIAENYFHSVFEAVKSVADRLRTMTGLYADGNSLAETAFSTQNPLIRINQLRDDSERSEHLGLLNLIKGTFGLIRNPTAHRPKITFPITETEALDIMVLISVIHKKLETAI